MDNIVIAGTSSPVIKLLKSIAEIQLVALQGVFLDTQHDEEAISFCRTSGIACYDIKLLNTAEGIVILQQKNIQWLFSVNSTIILRPDVLQVPDKGALNLHPGKLPEYAGLHTHQWAIRNGETTFGVTLHWMDEGIDTGAIACQSTFPVREKDTGLSLYLRCLNEGVKLVNHAMEQIASGHPLPAARQDRSKRKLYTNRMALDGRINWKENHTHILNFIRAADYAPFRSPTYIPFSICNNKTYYIKKAAESTTQLPPGHIRITEDNKLLVGTGGHAVVVKKILDSNQKPLAEEAIVAIAENDQSKFT